MKHTKLTPLHREKTFHVTWCGLKRTKRYSSYTTCLNGLAFESARKAGTACKSCDRALYAYRAKAKQIKIGDVGWYG